MEMRVRDCKSPSSWFLGVASLLSLTNACATPPSAAPLSPTSTSAPLVASRQEGESPSHVGANQLGSPAPSDRASVASPSPVGSGGPSQSPKAVQGITRTLLDQSDVPDLPGWETRLFLIEYAPGVAAPLHHHPAPGIGYVLSGSFESAFEGEPSGVVHEGQSFRDLPNVPHVTFKNTSATEPLKFVISYVVRKGAPVLLVP